MHSVLIQDCIKSHMLGELTASQIVNNQAVVTHPVKHSGNSVIHVDNSGCSPNTKTIIVYYIHGANRLGKTTSQYHIYYAKKHR